MNSFFTFTTGGANPTWVKAGGPTIDGTTYGGANVDGPAGNFLFGNETTFGAQTHFDQNFGTDTAGIFPSAGVAVYAFDNISMSGNPRFNTSNGPVDVAFVGVTGVTGSGTWDLSGLHSFFLGTAAGSINLGAPGTLAAVNGTAPDLVHLYAENGGAGNVILGATSTGPGNYFAINLPSTSFYIDADHNATIGKYGSITANLLNMNGVAGAQMDGTATANLIQMWSNGNTEVGGKLTATSFYGFGQSFTVNGKLIADNIAIQTSGDFTTGARSSVVSGKDIYVNAGGTLNLNTANTNTTAFDLSSATRFTAIGNAVNLTGNVIVPTGVLATLHAGLGNLTGSTFNLTGFDVVESERNLIVNDIDTRQLTVAMNANISGNLSAANVDIARALHVGGTITARPGDTSASPHVIEADSFQVVGGLNFAGVAGNSNNLPTNGGMLELHGSDVAFGTTGNVINGANFNGGGGKLGTTQGGGDGGTLDVGTDANPIANSITVNGAISATTGANSNKVPVGGSGGTVNLVTNGTATVNSTIKVSDSASGHASNKGGNIRVQSNRTSGAAINIGSTAQLLSLLNASAAGSGGTIKFVSSGGDINVAGKTQADRGTVEIRNNGSGIVNLTTATLSADVVKAGALGDNGTLTIGGGAINANTMLKLYAGGSNGLINFVSNVSLNGNSTKIISANTVTIQPNVLVTIGGANPAQVFTNNPNYTGFGGVGNGFGTFGGAGAVTIRPGPGNSPPGF